MRSEIVSLKRLKTHMNPEADTQRNREWWITGIKIKYIHYNPFYRNKITIIIYYNNCTKRYL